MNHIKNSLIAFGALSLFIGSFVLSVPRPTQGQGGDAVGTTRPVKVVNTPAEPVPVAGTVNVGNGRGNPLPVRDVDNPARQPVHSGGFCGGNGCQTTLYTVPAGKRFVIEYVSMFAEMPVGEVAFCRLDTFIEGRLVRHRLSMTAPAAAFDINPGASLGQQVRLYADAGTTVTAVGSYSGTVGVDGGFTFSVSGYLVDVP
ncbi:MAG TPA: hypothetical protein VM866_05410 [Pyrinomonadaceae bacterium]|jgi:hypothetical protein|nr:hypothetical protein [Pyrinomonadaceae bacterium]